MALWPREIQEKIQNTRRKDLKKGRLLAWYLIFYLVKDRMTDVKVTYSKAGKPHISFFHFNYSHSQSWLALAVSEREVGVDIETKRLKYDAYLEEKIRDMGFLWKTKANRGSDLYITSLWSAYEAWVKKSSLKIWQKKAWDYSEVRQKIYHDKVLSYSCEKDLEVRRLYMMGGKDGFNLCTKTKDWIFRL